MIKSKIIGTGSYLPKKIVSNDDLSKLLDTSDEWITSRTGIRQRHIADINNGENCSDMGTYAAKNALDMAKIKATDLDLIILATVTPDYRVPAASCLIQEKLGAINVPCFDISAACSGSIYGLNIAHNFIACGQYKKVLVIAAELMSSILNFEDRNTAVLFGDGASAAVLSSSNDTQASGFIDFALYADGSQQKNIYIPAGGSACPLDNEALKQQQNKVAMNGRETFKFAVRSICDAIVDILAKNNLTKDDIAFIVPHQANLRIIESIATKLDIPLAKFLINLDKCANTSAASLMLAYDEANRNNKLKAKDKIIMLAIGAGFVWGAALYEV